MKNYILIALSILAIFTLSIKSQSGQKSLSEEVISKGEIRIGYILYPPLLDKNPSTGELSGASYEIVEAAARRLGLKTKWTEEVAWGSAIEGLKTNRYDILGTQMWPNAARAREAVFSLAPFNSNIYAYGRAGDARFDEGLKDLNSPDFTISTLDGEMGQFIASQNYPNAKVNALPQYASYAEVFLNVVNNKADLAFVEPSTANDFLQSNPGSIVRISTNPLRTFGNSFAFKRGEESMVSMWNVALEELLNDGTIQKILEDQGISEDYILNK